MDYPELKKLISDKTEELKAVHAKMCLEGMTKELTTQRDRLMDELSDLNHRAAYWLGSDSMKVPHD